MTTFFIKRRVSFASLAIVFLVFLWCAGCGGGVKKGVSPSSVTGLSLAAASRGTGKVAFTIRWPAAASAAKSRLLPTASQSVKFSVVEAEAPNSVIVLTKTAARPSDDQATTTVLLDGLPTVLVTIKAEAFPNTDATGTVQASGTLTVQVEPNQTIDKSLTLDSTVKTVEVTAAAPVVIGLDGKFSLNLSDKTTVGGVKAALTASAYNAAHELVLTALDKWVYQSAKPSVATVSVPSDGTTTRSTKGKKISRAEGIGGAAATVTAVSGGDSVLTITESESQVKTQLTVTVIENRPFFWNQALGDAQNSSCSSGPSAGGVLSGSFSPVPDFDPNNRYARFIPWETVEDTNGNIAFFDYSSIIYNTYVYSKSGTKQGHAPGNSPAYGRDGTLYTIAYDNNSTTHIVAQGSKSWDFAVPGGPSSLLTLSGDGATLYVVLESDLYALNAATGEKRWQVSTPSLQKYPSKPAVSLDNATVYSRINFSGVAAFDAATGKKLWEIAGSEIVGNYNYVGVGPTGTVYAATNSTSGSTFRAIDPANGKILWANEHFGMIETLATCTIVLSRNGTVYGAPDGSEGGGYEVAALNGATGAIVWKAVSPDPGVSYRMFEGMGAGDGTLYVTKQVSRKLSEDNYYNVDAVAALNGVDGSEKWTLAPDTNSEGIEKIGKYRLQFVSGDGTVYAFQNPTDNQGLPGTIVSIK